MSNSRVRKCVAILCTSASDGRVLLVKSRKEGRFWELPGGKPHEGESLLAAARREMREETGLGVDVEFDQMIRGVPKPGAEFDSDIYVFRAHGSGPPTAGDDAEKARWFTADEVTALPLSDLATRQVLLDWVGAERTPVAVESAYYDILATAVREAHGLPQTATVGEMAAAVAGRAQGLAADNIDAAAVRAREAFFVHDREWRGWQGETERAQWRRVVEAVREGMPGPAADLDAAAKKARAAYLRHENREWHEIGEGMREAWRRSTRAVLAGMPAPTVSRPAPAATASPTPDVETAINAMRDAISNPPDGDDSEWKQSLRAALGRLVASISAPPTPALHAPLAEEEARIWSTMRPLIERIAAGEWTGTVLGAIRDAWASRGEVPPEVRAPQTPEVGSPGFVDPLSSEMAIDWRPTVGARVVTAEELMRDVWYWPAHAVVRGRRMPSTQGVVTRYMGHRWWVRHGDGLEVPYCEDELRPGPQTGTVEFVPPRCGMCGGGGRADWPCGACGNSGRAWPPGKGPAIVKPVPDGPQDLSAEEVAAGFGEAVCAAFAAK